MSAGSSHPETLLAEVWMAAIRFRRAGLAIALACFGLPAHIYAQQSQTGQATVADTWISPPAQSEPARERLIRSASFRSRKSKASVGFR
jgi:hypothetical protein